MQISIVATVNIDAKTARRRATAWLVSEVGNMLIGGTPQLVISQQTVWRVPAILTSSSVGTVGQVGVVDVDATSGETFVDEESRKQILDNVEHECRVKEGATRGQTKPLYAISLETC